MPRASKRPIRLEVQEELQDTFSYLISSLSSSTDIQRFFDSFLSDEEKTMLSKRLMIHLMLKGGYDVSDICLSLRVCRETVRTHKTVWILTNNTYKKIITKIANRQKKKEFWKRIEKKLRPLEYFATAKTNMKSRAKLFDPLADD